MSRAKVSCHLGSAAVREAHLKEVIAIQAVQQDISFASGILQP